MNETHQGHQPDNHTHHSHRPYWKRAHTDWRLWIAASLMFAAMIYYVMSMDLSWRLRLQPRPAPQDAVGR